VSFADIKGFREYFGGSSAVRRAAPTAAQGNRIQVFIAVVPAMCRSSESGEYPDSMYEYLRRLFATFVSGGAGSGGRGGKPRGRFHPWNSAGEIMAKPNAGVLNVAA